MSRHQAKASDDFVDFVSVAEQRLQDALTASFGTELGREATAVALGYAWEHWDRISAMENPVGYLYVLGRDRGRRMRLRRPLELPAAPEHLPPWVEPALPRALAGLPEKQRVTVILLHCFEWSMAEVADLLGVSKSTVQTHAERGMSVLRTSLGVTL